MGTAVKVGDGFQVTFGEITIGSTPDAAPPRRAAAPPPPMDGGMVFPPYGRSKGAPIAGASVQDLEYYASGCRRTLNDPNKARWHDKERQLLAAIEAEMARQGVSSSGGGRGGSRGSRGDGPPVGDEPPPYRDEDVPPQDEDLPF